MAVNNCSHQEHPVKAQEYLMCFQVKETAMSREVRNFYFYLFVGFVPELLVCYMLFLFQLYDGVDENANLVGTFCGSTVPAPFLSTSNSLTVKFVTDSSVEREGFNATYITVDRKYTHIFIHTYIVVTLLWKYIFK